MSSTVADVIQQLWHTDSSVRQNAEQQLQELCTNDYPQYVSLLSAVLTSQSQTDIMQQAALAFKNTLISKDSNVKASNSQRWMNLDNQVKLTVKQNFVQGLSNADPKAGMAAAQAVSAIAEVELPVQQWPELIPGLLQNVGNDSPSTRQASLSAIGYICESLDPSILEKASNEILTAVAQGARKDEPNENVKREAIRALYNSLEFVRNNFENEGERNYIMQIVCEATQSTNSEVQVMAYECLVRIVSLYYDKMQMYMDKALYGLSVSGMRSDNELVALQAVEFWSTVCEEEIELILEIQDAQAMGQQPTRMCYYFAKAALSELIPTLLVLLSKNEEDDDEDEWKISMSAATCISLLAGTVEDDIVQPVLQYVEGNIRSEEWRLRESSVMAFGSILEGPSPNVLGPLVRTALPVLLQMMSDPVVNVKDTAAWTLGRVCELLMEHARPFLQEVIQVLLVGLNDSARVASNCAWALINMSEQINCDPSAESYELSPYYESIVTSLMASAEKPDQAPNHRASAYEAVASFVSTCSQDCFPIVERLTMGTIERLEQTIQVQGQLVNMDDRNKHMELQANLCSVLTSVVRRMGAQTKPLCDRVMQILLTILGSASKNSTVMEDVFLAIGAVCSATDSDFLRYMDSFKPFLFAALSNHEEHALCSIAVGIVGDICRALNELILPFCDEIMNALLGTLQSNVLHRNVKPVILSCFGDIALAIGAKYEPYLQLSMAILDQAFKSTQDLENDYAAIDYGNALSEGVVEAYVGVVQGMKTGDSANALGPFVGNIFTFAQAVAANPESSESAIRGVLGLLGDLSEAFPPRQLSNYYNVEWIDEIIKRVRAERMSQPTRDVAKWLKEMVKRQK